jgi:hypothetical protein
VPGRSAIPAPAPGIDRCCWRMIMNSPGPARQPGACPAGSPDGTASADPGCPPRGAAAARPCGQVSHDASPSRRRLGHSRASRCGKELDLATVAPSASAAMTSCHRMPFATGLGRERRRPLAAPGKAHAARGWWCLPGRW